MIELKISTAGATVTASSSSNLLLALDNYLDKTKFFGTINITYKDGRPQYVRIEQGFTVENLLKEIRV